MTGRCAQNRHAYCPQFSPILCGMLRRHVFMSPDEGMKRAMRLWYLGSLARRITRS